MGIERIKPIFKDGDFQYLIEVDFQLASLREYIKVTEKTIKKEVKQKIKEYDNFLKKDFDGEIGIDFADYDIKIYTHQLYYNSLFISLYSFLERKMYQICKIAELNQSLKINDIQCKGSPIDLNLSNNKKHLINN
jgi:hypothetical protein